MIIVIDGYNLLKQIFPLSNSAVKNDIEKVRTQFIQKLSSYRDKKDHEIILVFDGGSLPRATREIIMGIVVIFSGYKTSADEWILDFFERKQPNEFLLVSNDRKLIDSSKKFGADSIDVFSFYKLLISSIGQPVLANVKSQTSSTVKKFSDEDEKEWSAYDYLIAQSDVKSYHKDDLDDAKAPRKSSSAASKKEKSIVRKIKKL